MPPAVSLQSAGVRNDPGSYLAIAIAAIMASKGNGVISLIDMSKYIYCISYQPLIRQISLPQVLQSCHSASIGQSENRGCSHEQISLHDEPPSGQ